jgi:hypothetical protein
MILGWGNTEWNVGWGDDADHHVFVGWVLCVVTPPYDIPLHFAVELDRQIPRRSVPH